MYNVSCATGTSDGSSSTPSSVATRWWVYLLLCRDGRTYAGVAIDVARRFRLHQRGKGAKFTRANPPLAILGVQPCADRSAALRAEHALKRLTHAEKLAWAQALDSRP
jgi:putative endonuclease